MAENFAELFEESIANQSLEPGSIVRGTVIDIDQGVVVVNAGLKSEGVIPIGQFLDERGNLEVSIGDEVEVALDAVEDGFGETILSREKAKRMKLWQELEEAYESSKTIIGLISGKVKGGFTVDIGSVRAFLPGSLVDVRPVRDTSHLEGKPLEFKVIKLDKRRNNAVVSRRAVVEQAYNAEREELLKNLAEGVVITGIVKNLTDYGAFVDLGGVDGLLHITDMAWRRIRHPSEVVNVGDEIQAKVLKYDEERQRVSLGIKQLSEDPWNDIERRYPIGSRLSGSVTNITDYGAFVGIEEGVEGLAHVSEMDWVNRNIDPRKFVQVGEELEVMILNVDAERRRISLGIKQCHLNPWQEFQDNFHVDDQVQTQVKSVTDFGVFVELEGGIDGLIHVSDLSWNESGEQALQQYEKGQTINAVILSINPERERISLGIKQLEGDPFASYIASNPRGSIVQGEVISVDERVAHLRLSDQIEGVLKASEAARDRVSDLKQRLHEGDRIDVQILNEDRKNRMVYVSIKAMEDASVDHYMRQTPEGKTSLGDVLREQMDVRRDES